MGTIKDIFLGASTLIPAKLLYREAYPETLLPYQHLVSDKVLPHIHRIYPYKGVRQFREDVDFLARHFCPVTPGELVSSLEKDGRTPPGTFLLTFDDGLREVHDIIAPILREKGIPAVFFVNPAFLDNKELFYRMKISILMDRLWTRDAGAAGTRVREILDLPVNADREQMLARLKAMDQQAMDRIDEIAGLIGLSFEDYVREWRPYMDLDQAKALARQGFTIGAHSWDHPYYRLLTVDKQIDQTVRSSAFVREEFGSAVNTFAFPHADGPVPQMFFDRMLVRNDCPDLFFGTQNQKLERKNRILHRFNAERPGISMEKMVSGIRLLTRMRDWTGSGKVQREGDVGVSKGPRNGL